MADPQPIESEVSPDVRQYIQQELSEGKSRAIIVHQLVTAGWDPQQARSIVEQAPIPASTLASAAAQTYRPAASRSAYPRAAASGNRAAGQRKMIVGACWFLGGIAVTGISYAAAANNPNGGTYVLAWGAVIFGLVDFIRGLILYMSA